MRKCVADVKDQDYVVSLFPEQMLPKAGTQGSPIPLKHLALVRKPFRTFCNVSKLSRNILASISPMNNQMKTLIIATSILKSRTKLEYLSRSGKPRLGYSASLPPNLEQEFGAGN